MRKLCKRPGIKFADLPLTGNWGNSSVYAVFGGSLLPHADESKIMEPCLCVFLWGWSGLVFVAYSPVYASVDLIVLYIVGGGLAVLT